MTKRIAMLGVGLVYGLAAWMFLSELPAAQAQNPPDWKYGLEFRVRKAGMPDFDKNTPRFGCEVYVDKTTNQALYITETGALGIVLAGNIGGGSDTKPPRWLHGLELKCRKAGEADFTKDTKKYGLEVFRDDNAGNLVYISETGSIAVVKATGTAPEAGAPKPPTWLHGLELKCRRGGEADFTSKTNKFGLEVFRDENNGNLVYICDNGSIAVIAPPAGPLSKDKAPTWLHGLEFRARKATEPDFTKDTRNYGAEIFKDENAPNLAYITELGSIGVVPAGTAGPGDTKAPKWTHGIVLKVRKAGEQDFTDTTAKVGVEGFRDENTGNLVYITESGKIGVATGK